jgi:hypothetical protein
MLGQIYTLTLVASKKQPREHAKIGISLPFFVNAFAHVRISIAILCQIFLGKMHGRRYCNSTAIAHYKWWYAPQL